MNILNWSKVLNILLQKIMIKKNTKNTKINAVLFVLKIVLK